MKSKLAQTAVILVALGGLIAAPTEMLDLVRWVAVAAIVVAVVWRFFRHDAAPPETNLASAPADAAPSAVLMVAVTVPVGRSINASERQLFKNAIMQCVRSSDRVSDIDAGLYSIQMTNVSPEMAERIAQRISEQLQDLIVFDDIGAIKQISVSVGGGTSLSGDILDGQRIARQNLAKLEDMRGVTVLLSKAA